MSSAEPFAVAVAAVAENTTVRAGDVVLITGPGPIGLLCYNLVAFKQLRVQGTVGYTRQTWSRALRLMDQGMRPSRIVTHTLPLSQWETGFDLFEAKEAVKVILQPDERYQDQTGGNER